MIMRPLQKKSPPDKNIRWGKTMLLLIVFILSGFSLHASIEYSADNFSVQYEPQYARYRINLVVHHDEKSGLSYNYGMLQNTRIAVSKDGSSWENLFYIHGVDHFSTTNNFQLSYSKNVGAGWFEENSSNNIYLTQSTSTVTVSFSGVTYRNFYWYPDESWVGSTPSFCLKEGRWERLNNTNDQIFNYSYKKTSSTMVNNTKTISITENTFSADGNNRISYSISGYNSYDAGTMYLQRSTDGGSTWTDVANQTAQASGTFTGKFMIDENSFLNGVSFRLQNRVIPQPGGYNAVVFRRNSDTFSTTKTSIIKSISAKAEGKNIIVTWLYNTVSGSQDMSDLELLILKPGVSNWANAITQNISFEMNKAGGEATYTLTDSELQQGTQAYSVMIRRKKFQLNSLWKDYFQQEASLNVNTSYKTIKTISHSISGNSITLNWTLTDGIWINNDLKYVVEIDGVPYNGSAPASNVTTFTMPNLERCTPMNISLRLLMVSGNIEISSIGIEKVMIPNNVESKISEISASKGYYSDKVLINWKVPTNASNFNYFILTRTQEGSSAQPITLAQISHNNNIYSYQDNNIDAGEYYNYTVTGYTTCASETAAAAEVSSIGFSQPYASVSGRIAYDGKQAVQGVDVMITGDDVMQNRSLDFSSRRDGNSYVLPAQNSINKTAYTFQAWVKPTEISEGVERVIIQQNDYMLAVHILDNRITVAGNAVRHADTTVIKPLEYFHLTLTVNEKTAKTLEVQLFINGKLSNKFEIANPKSNLFDYLVVGASSINGTHEFDGYMDELRFWNRILTAEEIASNYDRFISGKESDLVAYYRCDEPNFVGNILFDISAVKSNFNKNDATFGSAISRTSSKDGVPSSKQLSNKGRTDEYGNYLVNTIPYTNEGNIYNLTPFYGVHDFNPSGRPAFLSPSSRSLNNMDFTDVSSFDVSGRITYTGTDYPVEGVTFYIDGMICSKDNEIIRSKADGTYTISVPIGEHFITAKKEGHTFVNGGRYPADPQSIGSKHVFESPMSNLNFIDSTFVTIAGRVSGGDIEGGKALGLGESKANIGKATITLQLQDANKYMLNTAEETRNLNSANDYINATATIAKQSDKITIQTCAKSGEFAVQLPPVPLKVVDISTKMLDKTQLGIENIAGFEITNPNVVYTDSIESDEGVLRKFKYHHALNINYRVPKPTFKVTDSNTLYDDAFGEEFGYYIDETTGKIDTIQLYQVDPITHNVTYKFGYPAFFQKNKYNFNFYAYEEYENHDEELVITDHVPLQESVVTVANEFGIQSVFLEGESSGSITNLQENEVQLDESGEGLYTFTSGFPNINGNHLLSLNIQYMVGNKKESWDQNGNFMAYVFGMLPSGSDFVTAGPDKISMILRDPPGSESSAYWEEGVTSTNTVTQVGSFATSENITTIIHTGIEEKLITGTPAVGIITEAKMRADSEVGLKIDYSFNNSKTSVEKTTLTKRISTSGSSNYVGASGDVFIGNSTNLLFGMSRNVGLMKSADNIYSVGKDDVMTVGSEFNTAFRYTSNHIEDYLIPDMRVLRNSLLLQVAPGSYNSNHPNVTDVPIYITTLSPDDSRYGSDNDDVNVWGNAASASDDLGGPSYIMIPPAREDTIFDNKIVWYNSQIRLWEKALADNEKVKLDAFTGKAEDNYSFDAGASVESSTTKCFSEANTWTHDTKTQIIAGIHTGTKIKGIGISVDITTENTGGFEYSNGSETETCTTTGYTLADSNVGDYFSVDVFAPSDQFGVVFRTRGGQSSCPYEGAELTKYYKPGTELSAATMQIDIPVLSVDKPFATEIPSGKEATYILSLDNNSEANLDRQFELRVLDESNPNGAKLAMDGSVLTGRRSILVKAGETLTKTLKLSQTSVDVLDYPDIKLVLSCNCQDNIADTITISAQFVPTCSDITMEIDDRIVNVETSDTLAIKVKDYQMDYKNFKAIRLQYKSVSDIYWNLIKEYVLNNEDKTQSNELLESSSLTCHFPMTALSDGTYEIRTITVCDFGNGEVFNETPVIQIVKDMSPPASLGTPNPSNGILTTDNEVSILFNENIQNGKLTYSNFKVQSVLNGYTVRDNVGLDFDGQSNAYTELAITANGSFSIEGWFKRQLNTTGTLFSYGKQDDFISVGFTSDNKLVVTTEKQQPITSDKLLTDADWQYIALSYDRSSNLVNVYLNSNADGNISLLTDKNLGDEAPQNGRFYIGSDIKGENNYKGRVRQVHFWNKTRLQSQLADMNTAKSGSEQGLIGYWNLEEGHGSTAADKARSRSLLLTADWFIHPTGKSASFNGTSDFLTLNSELYPFDESNNFSIEFWFKGNQQSAATLLSAGHGKDDKDVNGKLSVALNADGKLMLRSTGNEYLLTSNKVTDNQWHHFAMSIMRGGNLVAYVDNTQTFQLPASQIGRMASSKIYLGACHYKTEADDVTNEYFTGSIDELRIWNAALTNDNFKLDTYSKLSGEESGLVAYYPFESYTYDSGNQLVVSSTFDDKTISEYDGPSSLTAAGIATFSDNTPPIKDKRPIEDVSYNWTASDTKIVFNLTESLSRMENCILEFTADRVLDMQNNRMASPVKWTAYVNMNRLLWTEEGKSLNKKVYDPLSFKAIITNQSGVNETYTISNIPSWVSCNTLTGVLAPQQSKEIEFVVNEAVEIGTYEAGILLTGNNNISESYVVSLKVNGEKPAWSVNASDYESSMTVMGQLKIEGTYQEDTDDIVAAFIGDECRGVASPVYVKSHNSYYLFMDIYGNASDANKAVDFRVWDAGTGTTFTQSETSEDIKYAFMQQKGSLESPVIINAMNVVDQQLSLRKGWNWISVNVESQTPSLFSMFKDKISDAGLLLKNADSYVQAPKWNGSMTEIANESMYRLQTSKEHNLTFTGKPVDVKLRPIAIKKGWNWIGYLPSVAMDVNEALASIEAQNGDQVRAHSGYAIYVDGSGWIGSLGYMKPGNGYMYYSKANAATLTYPTGSIFRSLKSTASTQNKYWSVNPENFQTNMTITAIVSVDGSELRDETYELGLFKNGECRGSAILTYEADFDKYIAYLMAYGDSGEELTFALFNHAQSTEIPCENISINFASDEILGTPDAPYVVNFTEGSGIHQENGISVLNIYPNPATDYLWFTLPFDKINKIEIIDMNSQILSRKEDIQQNNILVSDLAPGVYFIHFYLDESTSIFKFIKK